MSLILSRRCYHTLVKNFVHKNIAVFSAPNVNYCSYSNSTVPSEAFVTSFSNPADHSIKDVGFFYRVNNTLFLDVLFKNNFLEPNFIEQCKTFRETALMIRKPALEIIHYLKNANYNDPVNKYVLYGKHGNGVTFTMLQVIHYAYLSGWLIIHVPWVLNWSVSNTEIIKSTTMENFMEVPKVASEWLLHFKRQNEELINKLDLRLHNSYTWNIQEKNEKGDKLMTLVDHGISRSKYSCDTIIALLEELKQHSREGTIRTLVAIDGYSSLFTPFRKCKNKKRKHVAPYHISCMQGFKNLVKPDWHNGAALVSCFSDPYNNSETDYLPMNQLRRDGFEFLTPFVPIEVPKMSEKEMMSLLTYYRSQKWLLTSEADSELKVLSAGNFLTLRRICAPL